jgi:DNA-binding transcriptional ArsR family regulator
MSSDAVFAALADPTRRRLYEAVAASGPLTATQLASDLPISRQAVAKHLGVLHDAGLLAATRAGRETRFTVDTSALTAVSHWIDDVGGRWDRRLARLRSRVEHGTVAP